MRLYRNSMKSLYTYIHEWYFNTTNEVASSTSARPMHGPMGCTYILQKNWINKLEFYRVDL